MPIYVYQHPQTKEVKEIVQRMNEEHIFVDDKGIKWDRILSVPNMAMDTQFSAHSSEEFVKKTRGKKMSVGDMWDLSGELSEKRAGASGVDEIRVKAEEAYKKKTKGKEHPHSKKKSKFVF